MISSLDTLRERESNWLADLPSRHHIVMLRRIVEKFVDYRGKTPEKVEKGIPLVTARNLVNGKIDMNVSKEFMREDQYQKWMVRGWPEKGDVVVTTEAPLGAVAQIEDSHIALAQRVILLKLKKRFVCGEYLKFYLMSEIGQAELYSRSTGSTAIGIKAEKLKSIHIVLPDLREQKRIAEYLQYKMKKIEKLIEKKTKQIALLKEKRISLINKAVTKGLSKSVEMKDSGFEYFGEMPVHWKVQALRRMLTKIEQGWSPVAEQRLAEHNEWAVVKLSCVDKGRFRELEHKALSQNTKADERMEINEGDLLLTRSNTPELVGDVCFVQNCRNRLMLCDLIYRLRVKSEAVLAPYLNYFLLSKAGRAQIESDARGTSGSMVKISQEHIKSWKMLLPPIAEQKHIVETLHKEEVSIDNLIKKIDFTIERLKEYRHSLISAAVTGKIDLR